MRSAMSGRSNPILSRGMYPERFAMEIAVLLRLHDYTRMLGLPDCLMPLGDGHGGLVERSPVPDAVAAMNTP